MKTSYLYGDRYIDETVAAISFSPTFKAPLALP